MKSKGAWKCGWERTVVYFIHSLPAVIKVGVEGLKHMVKKVSCSEHHM